MPLPGSSPQSKIVHARIHSLASSHHQNVNRGGVHVSPR
jgi:hypothetical protein